MNEYMILCRHPNKGTYLVTPKSMPIEVALGFFEDLYDTTEDSEWWFIERIDTVDLEQIPAINAD